MARTVGFAPYNTLMYLVLFFIHCIRVVVVALVLLWVDMVGKVQQEFLRAEVEEVEAQGVED